MTDLLIKLGLVPFFTQQLPDVAMFATRCRFADCHHEAEPGCAVLRAIEEGKLDSRRLANYKKLLRENAQATATLAEKRAHERGFARVVKEAISMKRRKGDI